MKQLAQKYNPTEIENGKYNGWLEEGYFTAGDKTKAPYSIVLPPPNVTGKLHIGHALNTTLQDVMARFKRLQGFDVCFVAGMDHAGIATQAVVEKKLRGMGIDKYEIGREKFLEYAWDWKKEYAETIRKQWAKMGLSLDYSREAFTLDAKRNEAVRTVFCTLYEKGLIYRKEKIINWDPVLKTALSNIEVIYKEDPGKMFYFKYYVENEDKYVVVGTTRPETMFGDVAVVCNPKDSRYKWLKGKRLINPANGDPLQVIFDPYVDIEFGTGAMKCTPAQDPNDYNLGVKYKLDMIVCMNDDATMNEVSGKYNGLDRYECRKQLVNEIEEKGLVDHIEDITHQVGHSERSDAVIEPRLSKQWFVSMKGLSKASLDMQADENEKVNFFPPRFEKNFVNWMEGIEDWCISRQLWWGHRIPAYYHKDTGEVLVSYNPPKDIENYIQDEDVLDTWFSSALWPFTTLGWPDDTDDVKRYYPNSLMVTAFDIILFWVSRMMFQAVEFTGKMPFNHCLIHGLIRDEQGRKMSKSLGNGVDPMDVIAQYGADAMRYFLATSSAPGLDFRFSTTKIEASWNFLNKIWNASRFVLMNLPHDFEVKEIDDEKLTLADKWILSKLAFATNKITENLEKYEFANVGTYLTNFIWTDFCSWYIEMSKLSLLEEAIADNTRQVLVYVLKQIVVLLHPFAPFISDEIYQAIPGNLGSIHKESWPNIPSKYLDEKVAIDMDSIIEVITLVRNLRNTENIANSVKLKISVFDKSENDRLINAFNANLNYLYKFTNAEEFVTSKEKNFTSNGRVMPITDGELFVSLENAIDYDKELARLSLELSKVEAGVARGEAMFNNPSFVARAPQFKIDAERKILDDYLSKRSTILKRINELNELKNK